MDAVFDQAEESVRKKGKGKDTVPKRAEQRKTQTEVEVQLCNTDTTHTDSTHNTHRHNTTHRHNSHRHNTIHSTHNTHKHSTHSTHKHSTHTHYLTA